MALAMWSRLIGYHHYGNRAATARLRPACRRAERAFNGVAKLAKLLAKFQATEISNCGAQEMIPTTMIGRPRARTPDHSAPEIEKGHTRGRSADNFSLRAVFSEMLTVCSDPRELEEFRSRLQTKNRRSYAENVPRVFEWLDILQQTPCKVPWHSTVLSLSVPEDVAGGACCLNTEGIF